MPKTSGALFAFEAAGTLHGTLTYAKQLGRQYAKWTNKFNKQRTTLTKPQLIVFACCGHAWSSISLSQRAVWTAMPRGKHMTPHNLYTQWNLHAWQSWYLPKPLPTLVNFNNTSNNPQLDVRPALGQITGHCWDPDLPRPWGIAINVCPVGQYPDPNNLRVCKFWPHNTPGSFTIKNLASGAYVIFGQPWSQDGDTNSSGYAHTVITVP